MAHRFELTTAIVAALLLQQDGVIARRQLIDAGARAHDVERLVRRRELRRVHPGVYVAHTGPLTPRQRQWAAVLAAWPAALAGTSALPGQTPAQVHVAIERGRNIRAPQGAVLHHTSDLEQRVQWQRSPPRLRIEHALLNVMAELIGRGEIAGAFSELARVSATRQTTAPRILEALAARQRVTGRKLISEMLTDWRDGVCSVLERGYRSRVERPHGLPRPCRQRPSSATGALTLQDVRYDEQSLVVELDGHAFHGDAAARDRDAGRDLDELAVSDTATARVTYGLVFTSPCRTAARIGQILRRRGWAGALRHCPSCPPPDH